MHIYVSVLSWYGILDFLLNHPLEIFLSIYLFKFTIQTLEQSYSVPLLLISSRYFPNERD